MKLSIVWRCAIAIAVAQVAVFVAASALVLATGFAPLYRVWADQTAETLHAHHQLLHNIANEHGARAAAVAAMQLSTTDLKHRVIDPADWAPSADYIGMPGARWLQIAQRHAEPTARRGEMRWITGPVPGDGRSAAASPSIVLSWTHTPVTRVFSTQPIGAGLWISGILLFAAIVGGLVATWFTRPILRLRQSVMQFAAGRLDARPDPRLQSRRDELGDLTRDLTAMKDRIANLVGAQRQLLDDVAHELRSPLARMNVALELVEQTHDQQSPPVRDDWRQFLARVRRESELLSIMTDRLLQLSALEHQVDGDDRTKVNLTQLTRAVVEDCNFEAQGADRRVTFQGDPDVHVLGNHEMLATALENIIRNAIRYTPTGTSVDVAVHDAVLETDNQPSHVRVVVRDQGPGVPDELLTKLFQPFFRVASDRNAESGGVGLGLALADRIVRAHAGTLTAANRQEGGLEVSVNLPAGAPPTRPR